jgi:hypothetical protein
MAAALLGWPQGTFASKVEMDAAAGGQVGAVRHEYQVVHLLVDLVRWHLCTTLSDDW